MMKKTKIAVVGATGNVGRAMLSILEERGFPLKNITAVASDRSAGTRISYGEDGDITVMGLTTFDFSTVDVALFSPGAVVSSQYAPKAAAQGCVVIDNTSYFRLDPDVPLVIPEVNEQEIAHFRKKNIIANPNCSTIQLLMALKPLHDIAPIKRIVVDTYQSTSGAGKEAIDELYQQSKGIFVHDDIEPHYFPKQIAFNIIPQIDTFMDDGQTREEWKMVTETQKILDPTIQLIATCVRVPVFIGHAVAAHVEFHNPISPQQARSALKKAPGIALMDNPATSTYITPVECAGDDAVFVSRIRADKTVPHGLSLWIVADNIRKGAALNAVQILEILIKKYLLAK